MSKYKVVAFDFDGVLVESEEIKQQAFEYVFVDQKINAVAIKKYLDQNLPIIRFEKFRFVYEQILNVAYDEKTEQVLSKKFSDYVIDRVIASEEVQGSSELLKFCYERVPVYLVSVNPDEDLRRILEGRDLTGFFKKIIAVDGDKTLSLQRICHEQSVDSSEVVFIGDSLGDYHSAKNARVDFLARERSQVFDSYDVKKFNHMGDVQNFFINENKL